MFAEVVAAVCIAWFIFIALVCAIGDVFLFNRYRKEPLRASILSRKENHIPHVTAIRPCKGLEPYLYECLASTFHQDYPRDKITIHFCVSSRSDPAHTILERVVRDYPDHDCQIFVEEEDDQAASQRSIREHLGPNPKIRNMSRAYREAKGDLIWIIDCNVWVGRGVCGRMVDKLTGNTSKGTTNKPYKLVHHLPISVDVDSHSGHESTADSASYDDTSTTPLLPVNVKPASRFSKINGYGGRLEELFLASSHAKMYVAINTVAVAPCIVGKSTMFRKSHLDFLTSRLASKEAKVGDGSPTANPIEARTGIDYFSQNICEDHLIGDLLWKSPTPAIFPAKMRNHGLVYGDLAIQPVAGMTVGNYIARRVRWLRVRKFTVPVATLVEPGTESFLCSAYAAWGATTSSYTKHVFGDTWMWFGFWWLVAVTGWGSVDWLVYLLLHSGKTMERPRDGLDDGEDHKSRIPPFARPLGPSQIARRGFTTWLVAWLGREALALPIWTWAIWGGVSVTWRERRFWVGMDMKVHEIHEAENDATERQAKDVRPAMKSANGHPLVGGSGTGSTPTTTKNDGNSRVESMVSTQGMKINGRKKRKS